jgi:hypothetical protein
MSNAKKLVLQYFHIVCRLDLQDTPIDFEGIKQWAENSLFYQSKLNDAIKCAIEATKLALSVINGWANDKHEQLEKQLEELEAMV